MNFESKLLFYGSHVHLLNHNIGPRLRPFTDQPVLRVDVVRDEDPVFGSVVDQVSDHSDPLSVTRKVDRRTQLKENT
jgi:hypothetical protein